jgi:CheY-like chemotaxis protein
LARRHPIDADKVRIEASIEPRNSAAVADSDGNIAAERSECRAAGLVEIARSLAAVNGGRRPRRDPEEALSPELTYQRLAPSNLHDHLQRDPGMSMTIPPSEIRSRNFALQYSTITASDGIEGLTAFQTRSPDLVLADLAMPRSMDSRCSTSAPLAFHHRPSVRGIDATVRALISADDSRHVAAFRERFLRASARNSACDRHADDDLQFRSDRPGAASRGRAGAPSHPTDFHRALAINAGKPMFIEQPLPAYGVRRPVRR